LFYSDKFSKFRLAVEDLL